MYQHHVTGFSLLDLLSNLGGLFNAIFTFLSVIGAFYNSRTLLGHLISKLYFIKYSCQDSQNGSNELKVIKFNNSDIFSHFKLPFYRLKNFLQVLFCKKKRKESKDLLS